MCSLGCLWSYAALPHKSFCHAFTPTLLVECHLVWNLCYKRPPCSSFQVSLILRSRRIGLPRCWLCWDSAHLSLPQWKKQFLFRLQNLISMLQCASHWLHCRFFPCKIGMIIPVLLSSYALQFIRFVVHALWSSSLFLYVPSLLLHI